MKFLVTTQAEDVAPRFDLATEVTIVTIVNNRQTGEPRTILLPGPSADELCGLVLKEDVSVVICGGIEEEHYQYFSWKKIKVIDRVIGRTVEVLRLAIANKLRPGAVVV